ncbi:uncharacterized protein LOC124355916 [Homalodisca vitripennis]|uniref:uncharacterized protein LOC124355916 n=1 Tax=Homalodisca vitripennis TaxID=197043 RepID=UPI001EE9EF8B|nr:uncharacterized protein LOC124355916 [Homalodisca vitripennis]
MLRPSSLCTFLLCSTIHWSQSEDISTSDKMIYKNLINDSDNVIKSGLAERFFLPKTDIVLTVFNFKNSNNYCSFYFHISHVIYLSPRIEARYENRKVYYTIHEGSQVLVQSVINRGTLALDDCYNLRRDTKRIQACVTWRDIKWYKNQVCICLYAHLNYDDGRKTSVKIKCCQLINRDTRPPTIPPSIFPTSTLSSPSTRVVPTTVQSIIIPPSVVNNTTVTPNTVTTTKVAPTKIQPTTISSATESPGVAYPETGASTSIQPIIQFPQITVNLTVEPYHHFIP